MRILSLLAALIATSILAVANPAEPQKLYTIAFDVSHMGKTIGAPIVVVREGTEGSMELAGPSGYKMTFIATDAGDGKTKVVTTFASNHGTSSPTVIVKDGHAAFVSDGRFEFRILVRPQRS